MVRSPTVRRLALLGRIKSMRLRIAMQHGAKQAAIVAFALLLALGGIGMLMFCLFTVIAAELGIISGALIAGLLLLVFAGLAIAASARLKLPAEAHVLDNVEAALMGELNAEIADIETSFKRLESGASALFKGDYLTAFANIAGGLK